MRSGSPCSARWPSSRPTSPSAHRQGLSLVVGGSALAGVPKV
jgi:hypothetical protein